ncbi:hypothetical protein PIB30_083182 [Stylosanthes scabra]|uniref:FBD domain-containing protein n=1 Tax=Stylosanthes scabra TaxID=79078 RepID=A0ABU6RS63_9FABA|nr:hypothetical protein [Stylosanthes scabra]
MAEYCRSNKRRKLVNEIDIISTLPDCLLCHILSFLPNTASIVATTSLLSRRWRYLWKDLQAFHFKQSSFIHNCGSQYYCTSKSPLMAYAKSFLSQRTTHGFRKFHLDCSIVEEELSTVESWVETAIGPNLEELQLRLFVKGRRKLVIPPAIFNCTALVTLSLGSFGEAVMVLNRSSYHLPSLKNFSLVIDSTKKLEALLSGCPVLETLDLSINHKCPIRDLFHNPNPRKRQTIRVVSSFLKSLTIRACYPVVIIEELEIDASSLEYLCISVFGELEELSVRNLQKVETADLNFLCAGGGYSLIKLLNEIPSASDLSLTLSSKDSGALPVGDLMDFNHLQQLTVQYFDTTVVMDILEKCHVLQDLTICCHQEGGVEWREPMDVPNCVVSHLERVSFFMDYGSKNDREFISYILQKGLILKSVIIRAHPKRRFDFSNNNYEEELSLIPIASKMCQLEIVTS